MRLESISYTEYSDKQFRWDVKNLTFIDINLIVAKNATGKSRVLRVIFGLARLIVGGLTPANITSGNYKASFSHRGKDGAVKEIEYELDISGNQVVCERLILDGVIKLNRGSDGRAKIHFEKNGLDIDIRLPENQTVIAMRRDSEQHPFFEFLHEWASCLRMHQFGLLQPGTATVIDKNYKSSDIKKPEVHESVHLLYKLANEKFGRSFVSSVIGDMNRLGYKIDEIGLMPISGEVTLVGVPQSPQTLYVIEKEIDKKMPENELSTGLFRALTVLIHLHATRLAKIPSCILIDDIGEGLDFDRASKLISVLIKNAQDGYIQLIMSSNDRFVMNNVPLAYWCVLDRKGGEINIYNPRTSPERFEEFEEYGLNNFDFFSRSFFFVEA